MKLQRTIICITGVFFAIGFAESQASAQPPECALAPLEIEINALRGGSPTVTAGEFETKKITAKARIAKGTAVKGTTVDTTLRIDTFDGEEFVNFKESAPHQLEVGKGGTGATLAMDTPRCDFGPIEFRATFFVTDHPECKATKSITKTCK